MGLWDEADVSHWLEGIGMGEYTATFLQHNVNTGTNLLLLQKSDLQVRLFWREKWLR